MVLIATILIQKRNKFKLTHMCNFYKMKLRSFSQSKLLKLFYSFIFLMSLITNAQTDPIKLKYLGTAGWEISDGEITVLVDPYISRFKCLFVCYLFVCLLAGCTNTSCPVRSANVLGPSLELRRCARVSAGLRPGQFCPPLSP